MEEYDLMYAVICHKLKKQNGPITMNKKRARSDECIPEE